MTKICAFPPTHDLKDSEQRHIFHGWFIMFSKSLKNQNQILWSFFLWKHQKGKHFMKDVHRGIIYNREKTTKSKPRYFSYSFTVSQPKIQHSWPNYVLELDCATISLWPSRRMLNFTNREHWNDPAWSSKGGFLLSLLLLSSPLLLLLYKEIHRPHPPSTLTLK